MKTIIIFGLLLILSLGVSTNYAQEFTLTTTSANIISSKSSIDMPGLTSNPFAIIVATPLGDTETYNPNPIGVWYYADKWNIFNSNHAVMAPGLKYKIQFFLKPGSNQFVHIMTQQNIGSEGSYIDHPALNNNPNAQIKILQVHAPDIRTNGLNRFKAKADYSSAAGRWFIANIGGEPLTRNSAYNIVITSGGAVGSNTNTNTNTNNNNDPNPNSNVSPPTSSNGNTGNNPNNSNNPNTNTNVINSNSNSKTPVITPPPTPVPLPIDENSLTKVATPTPSPTPKILNGFVDLHTHPMSHLGFGGKLMHGSPDIGIKMLGGTKSILLPGGIRICNPADSPASTIQEALGNCSATHGGWGDKNPCGDHLRSFVLNNLFDKHFIWKLPNNLFNGGNLLGDHQHEGFEASQNLFYFPSQTSKTHQQMWWEWIKRAKEKGNLRVMVALTVNSELLANILNGGEPKDDKASSELQLDEMLIFFDKHKDFMEIAKTPDDLRRIVGEGKLAVILGMEVDNIGNFNKETANQSTVRAEIERLYNKGIRYIFPIHLVDNKVGGSAVYEDLFNFSNKYSTGGFFNVTTSSAVKFRLGEMSNVGVSLSASRDVKQLLDGISGIPYPPAAQTASFQADPTKPGLCLFPFPNPVPTLGCWNTFRIAQGILRPGSDFPNYNTSPTSQGHINAKGLAGYPNTGGLGEFAIKEMMKLGMLIDIDHMSDKSQDQTLTIAEKFQYPVNIGHNGVRKPDGSERHASIKSIKRVAKLGGIFGIGTADSEEHIVDAQTFINSFEAVWSTMALEGGSPAVAIGTDVNGMERLPRASTGLNSNKFYSADYYDDIPNNLEENFEMCKTGNRTWNYTTEGVAHYGLIADFMRDVRKRNVLVHQRMMDSAEYFALMWEKAEKQKLVVK